MGRGRAKAKQQKVARDLKYNTPHTDFNALQHELGGDDGASSHTPAAWDEDEDDGRWASAR